MKNRARLIDADGVKDSLLTDLLTGVDGGTDASYLKTYEVIDRIEKIVNECVDNQITVEALPIDWLEKWVKETYPITENWEDYMVSFGELIKAWEAENNE